MNLGAMAFRDLNGHIIGHPLGLNYFKVTADMSLEAWNTAAAHEIATVTGLNRVVIIPECTETLVDAADGASIQFGVEGATSSWIGSTGAAGAGGNTIAAGELWVDTSPADITANFSAMLDKVLTDLDIGYEITGAALTNGTMVFHVWWTPLDPTNPGTVVAGTGVAL